MGDVFCSIGVYEKQKSASVAFTNFGGAHKWEIFLITYHFALLCFFKGRWQMKGTNSLKEQYQLVRVLYIVISNETSTVRIGRLVELLMLDGMNVFSRTILSTNCTEMLIWNNIHDDYCWCNFTLYCIFVCRC